MKRLSEMTIKEFIEFVSEPAKSIFKIEGVLKPMYHAIKSDGEEIIIPTILQDKDLTVTIIKEIFKELDIVKYVFMSEAWTLSSEKDKVPPELHKKGISEHPDRKEIILIMGEDDNGSTMASMDIIRRQDEDPTLGPLVFVSSEWYEGRMVGLLPQKGKVH
jgi:hypothetical protein